MAMPSPIIGMKARELMLKAMLVAASSTMPSLPISRMKTVKPKMSIKNCTPLGKPKRRMRRSRSGFGRQPEAVAYSRLFLRVMIIAAKTRKETTPETTVEMAAPVMPNSGNPKLPNISR